MSRFKLRKNTPPFTLFLSSNSVKLEPHTYASQPSLLPSSSTAHALVDAGALSAVAVVAAAAVSLAAVGCAAAVAGVVLVAAGPVFTAPSPCFAVAVVVVVVAPEASGGGASLRRPRPRFAVDAGAAADTPTGATVVADGVTGAAGATAGVVPRAASLSLLSTAVSEAKNLRCGATAAGPSVRAAVAGEWSVVVAVSSTSSACRPVPPCSPSR